MFASPFASKVSPFAIKVGPASFIFANNLSPDFLCLRVRGGYVRKPLQIGITFFNVQTPRKQISSHETGGIFPPCPLQLHLTPNK